MSISSLPSLSIGALLVVYSLQSIVSTALVKNAKFSRLSPHYIHLNDYHYEIICVKVVAHRWEYALLQAKNCRYCSYQALNLEFRVKKS